MTQKERSVPGNFGHVIKAYLDSPKFRETLSASTQYNYRHQLALAESVLGSLTVDVVRPALVQAYLDGLSKFPGKQINAKTALKAVEKWAMVRDLLPHTITLGTETAKSEDGHEPWTDQEVEIAVENARPDIGRAILLAASTGQRGSDIVKMRFSDLQEQGGRLGINIEQKKTGVKLLRPFTYDFAEKVAKWEKRPPFFLVLAPDGRPFTRNRLSHDWTYERESNPALAVHKQRGLVLHGLRATAVVWLARQGASTREISAIVGMSDPMVARYCRLANKNKLALDAMNRIDNVKSLQAKLLKYKDPTI